MTIRRDVTELSKEKQTQKLYGGAEKLDSQRKRTQHLRKIHANIDEKKYIGKVMERNHPG